MLRAVVTNHLGKLERVATAAKWSPDFDVRQARLDDKKAFSDLRPPDAQGPGACLRRDDYDHGRNGFSASDINDVWQHLCLLRNNKLDPINPHVLRRLVEDVEAVPTAMNLGIAQGIYYRGLKLALASIDRRYGGNNRVEEAGCRPDDPCAKRSRCRARLREAMHYNDPPRDPPKKETLLASASLPMAIFEEFTEKLITTNAKQEHWDGKTQRRQEPATSASCSSSSCCSMSTWRIYNEWIRRMRSFVDFRIRNLRELRQIIRG